MSAEKTIERIEKKIFEYQTKNGFDTTFDFILEDIETLKEEYAKQSKKEEVESDMVLGFIKSKGIRQEWDYWVDCWENEKPYDPNRFEPQPQEKQEEVKGYWWCPECKIEVDSSNVTFEEFHDACGTHVEWKELKPQPQEKVDFKKADCILAVCAVPHGYQIDLLDYKKYLDGKVVERHSECRSYGIDIDVEKFTDDLMKFIRNGGNTLQYNGLREAAEDNCVFKHHNWEVYEHGTCSRCGGLNPKKH